jgi:hypothetical protein
MATSLANHRRPIFKARELRTPEETQWYVEAEWADGTIEEIGQFKSISEAWNWIAQYSHHLVWCATSESYVQAY